MPAAVALHCQDGRVGRVGRRVLIRTDGAGGTHAFIDYLERQKLSYSVGFGLTDQMVTRLDYIPAHAWTPAYNADGHPLDLSGWPAGMRVIVRKERPHPGAQLGPYRGYR
jgi:hypothetical protein